MSLEVRDLFSAKTKLLILMNKIAKTDSISIENLFEELLDTDSELNVLKEYSSRHSAKTALKRHLDQLEKEGTIELVSKFGEEIVVLKRRMPNMNILKLDKLFSNNIIVACLVISLLMFLISLLVVNELMIVQAIITLGMILSIYISYKIKVII